MTHENQMPKTTWVFPKRRRSLICAMSWDKASSKKCVTKSWKPIGTPKMHKLYVAKVQPWKNFMVEKIHGGLQLAL